MAQIDNKDKPTVTATTGKPIWNAGKRRSIYGSNTAILVIAAVLVVVFVDWLSVRFNYSKDCTTGGIYSLSPKTLDLLQLVDKTGHKFYLVNEFPTSLDADPGERAQGLKIQRLIREYADASSHVVQYKPATLNDLKLKIRKRFGGQFGSYRKAVNQFTPLAAELHKFSTAEAKKINTLAANPAAVGGNDQAQNFATLQLSFSHSAGVPRLVARLQRKVAATRKNPLPDWPALTSSLASNLGSIQQQFEALGKKNIRAAFSPLVQKLLQQDAGLFAAQAAKIKAYISLLNHLKPVKSSHVLSELRADSLIVIGPRTVQVLRRDQLFVPQGNSEAGRLQYLFQGEQAVNSALLAMTETHRTKVVFVSANAMNLISAGGPFSAAAKMLRQNNFKVYQWSPGPGGDPQSPTSSQTPPAMGKGVIWVILDLPPSGQMAQMGSMIYSLLEQKISQQLAQGGNALFLLSAMPPQLMMMTQGQIPFKSILAGYGIRLRSTYQVVQRMAMQGGRHVDVPQIQISSYPDTIITKPLESLATMLAGAPSQNGSFILSPTYVGAMTPQPKGVRVGVFLKTASGPNTFGQTQPAAPDAAFNPSTDLKSPVPLGVMANKGGQRVVAIGNVMFVTDQLLNSSTPVIANGALTMISNFPGNAELFMNSIYWLAHQSHLIAASPRATVALRIARMSSSEEAFVRLSSFAMPAILAIAIGLMVYVARRRI
ncbi:MAG: hypothetical protein ACP5I8_13150 [Phycisphaerae bacterium]